MNYRDILLDNGYDEAELMMYDTDGDSIDKRLADIVEEDTAYAKIHARELMPKREEAYKYYRGESMGNERAGRSKFVSRDIMTTIEWKMPSMMRYFCQNDKIVTAEPIGADDEERARKAEALLNYDFFIGNRGFTR